MTIHVVIWHLLFERKRKGNTSKRTELHFSLVHNILE